MSCTRTEPCVISAGDSIDQAFLYSQVSVVEIEHKNVLTSYPGPFSCAIAREKGPGYEAKKCVS